MEKKKKLAVILIKLKKELKELEAERVMKLKSDIKYYEDLMIEVIKGENNEMARS